MYVLLLTPRKSSKPHTKSAVHYFIIFKTLYNSNLKVFHIYIATYVKLARKQ